MLYAKVVLDLGVEGPFDYIVPGDWQRKIKAGARVKVDFSHRKMTGFVVGLSPKTEIKKLKPLIEVIDEIPVLDRKMLLLSKKISEYYACSRGEALATLLPLALREGRYPLKNDLPFKEDHAVDRPVQDSLLLYDLSKTGRWQVYLSEIKAALEFDKGAIVVLPDIESALKAKEDIGSYLKCPVGLIYRQKKDEAIQWLKAKRGDFRVVVGTRANVFTPCFNLGLIIIDEEQGAVYKQEQTPHYHVRQIAFMRAVSEKVKIIFGSTSPSLEIYQMMGEGRIRYSYIPPKSGFPEIKIIDMRRQYFGKGQSGIRLTKYCEEAINSVLAGKGKVLLFLNRRGFATYASCMHCNTVLKCPRCNINLVYYFKENIVSCRYCNFKMTAPGICPHCNCGYIRYLGAGTEKAESELSRIFPQARICQYEPSEGTANQEADIYISTSAIIKGAGLNFDLIAVLSIDNALNRMDFRSAEKAFGVLSGLLSLTEKNIIIQTSVPLHHCFQSLAGKDVDMFYKEELKQRKQLGFPPYRHIGLVKLRGKKEERVKAASDKLFAFLSEAKKSKGIKVASVSRPEPSKLRGNFYWQVLIFSDSATKISKFLKNNLKKFSHSGIILTTDIDPL